jgi:hypothetical protein
MGRSYIGAEVGTKLVNCAAPLILTMSVTARVIVGATLNS